MKLIISLLTIVLVGCFGVEQEREYYFFGLATLKGNGDICLQIRSETENFERIETYNCTAKTDPNYEAIFKHVSPIEVGQEKEIEPFE